MPITYDTGSANTLAANSTTVTTDTITTAEADELLISFFFGADNTLASLFTAATSPTNQSIAAGGSHNPIQDFWGEVADTTTTSGSDTGNAFAHAVKTTAGATGTLQTTAGNSSRHGLIVGAFKLPTGLSIRYARPLLDISNSGWSASSGSDLYAMIDEEAPSDTDYIFATTSGATYEGKLQPVEDPATSTNQVIKYRTRSIYGNTLIAKLKQGSTVIATRTHESVPSEWTTYSMILSESEANAITDYTDLRIVTEIA